MGMAKDLNDLKWVEEFLPSGTFRRPMFGGFGYYLEEKMILAAFEGSSEDRTYREKTFPFALWLGCLFPAEKENHNLILGKFPFLIPHPVLPKWLYLPLQTENFESLAEDLFKELKRKTSLFGVIPKKKSKKSKTGKGSPKAQLIKIDTRKPQMFQDAPTPRNSKKKTMKRSKI